MIQDKDKRGDRKCGSPRQRKGGAVVEMIMVLPVLLVIFMGSVEACNLMFLQQATTEAAYDGALRAIRPGATEADVQANVTALLAARGITATSVEVGRTDTYIGYIDDDDKHNGHDHGDSGTPTIEFTLLEDVDSGELFSVKITIDTEGHLISPVVFATFSEIETVMTARKQ